MSVRRFRTLVRGIPHGDSALGRDLGAIQPGEWDTTDELLALVAELVAAGNHLFLSAHTRKGTTLPDPLRIPRPNRPGSPTSSSSSSSSEPREQSSPAELAAFLGGSVRVSGPGRSPSADE